MDVCEPDSNHELACLLYCHRDSAASMIQLTWRQARYRCSTTTVATTICYIV